MEVIRRRIRHHRTVLRSELRIIRMGCGAGKPTIVIDKNRVREYVGTGWITLRLASKSDKRQYPRVIEG